MKTPASHLVVVSTALVMSSHISLAEEADPTSLGGVIYSHFGMDFSEGAELANEFDIDRVYLTAKRTLSDSLGVRVTADMNRTGAEDDEALRLYIKYAYLEMKDVLPDVKLRLGAAGMGFTGHYDQFVGQRYIRKSFTDSHKILDSADIGVHALGAHGKFSWQGAVVNGGGYKSAESDKAKAGQITLGFDPMSDGDASLPIYAFFRHDLGSDTPMTSYGLSTGFKSEALTAWGEFVMESETIETVGTTSSSSRSGMGYSATLMPHIGDLMSIIVRYDSWDTDTAADGDASNTLLAGVTHDFSKKVSIGVIYEHGLPDTDDGDASQALFLRTQAGF